jgi:hypothetical protein
MALVVWAIIMSAAVVFFLWSTNLIKKDTESERFDAGLAIVEFGRAYPDEAIRQILMTVDGEMVFLRLWTGRCGCMRRNGARYLCHLIDPSSVRVTAMEGGTSLLIDFPGVKALTGEFRFASPKEAAEVSLWILGSFTTAIEQDYDLPHHA